MSSFVLKESGIHISSGRILHIPQRSPQTTVRTNVLVEILLHLCCLLFKNIFPQYNIKIFWRNRIQFRKIPYDTWFILLPNSIMKTTTTFECLTQRQAWKGGELEVWRDQSGGGTVHLYLNLESFCKVLIPGNSIHFLKINKYLKELKTTQVSFQFSLFLKDNKFQMLLNVKGKKMALKARTFQE